MRSYFKFLSRNLLYTIIEAIGLILSLAFVLLIGNYAARQIGIRHENPYYRDVYSVDMEDCPGLSYGFTSLVKERVPEVNASAAFAYNETIVTVGDEEIISSVAGVNRDFFEVFPYYDILSGDPDMINSKSQAFVSRSFANTHSLSEGMTLSISKSELTVCGIIEDFDGSLLQHADVILSVDWMKQKWGYADFDNLGTVMTFIRTDPGSDIAAVTAKVEAVCKDAYYFYGSSFFKTVKLDRFDTLFFRDFSNEPDAITHGDRDALRILILVGLLMLLSAVFNYLNLNIALTGRRAREMAIRRLTGATRGGIFAKYIGESVLFTFVCVALSLTFAVFVSPYMDVLLSVPGVPLHVSFTWKAVMVYLLFTIIIGTVTGLAPAFLASRFNPVEIVKGEFRTKNKKYFSKVFIVFQNALTVFMIALALVMECQYRTILNRPLNANVKDLYVLNAHGGSLRQDRLISELEQLPCVTRVGTVIGTPGNVNWGQYSKTREGEDIKYHLYSMDTTAFAMFGIQILEDFGVPTLNSAWFSDRAFKATGFDKDFHDISNTLAKRVDHCEQVAGIVKEFPSQINNLNDDGYMVIRVLKREDFEFSSCLIETTGDHKTAKAAINDAFTRVTAQGAKPEIYQNDYIEDMFKEQMRPTRNNTKLMELFMLISLIISFMGLLAMSTYFAGEKSRDIALRKVFGGTVKSETIRSVRQYIIQVSAAVLIAIPLAVYATSKYLEQFAYQLQGYWWIFAVAAAATFILALAAVLWQTLRTARKNPSEVLNKE